MAPRRNAKQSAVTDEPCADPAPPVSVYNRQTATRYNLRKEPKRTAEETKLSDIDCSSSDKDPDYKGDEVEESESQSEGDDASSETPPPIPAPQGRKRKVATAAVAPSADAQGVAPKKRRPRRPKAATEVEEAP